MQNKFTEDQFNAFYEGKLEPFALQLSLVISNMLFTPKELAFGNSVIFTANRLQYASNTTKLNVSTQLFDRGILTTNQVMDIWNLAHVDGGDERKIRGEYVELDEMFIKLWNELLPQVPLYSNTYITVIPDWLADFEMTPFWGFQDAIVGATVRT